MSESRGEPGGPACSEPLLLRLYVTQKILDTTKPNARPIADTNFQPPILSWRKDPLPFALTPPSILVPVLL